MTCHGQIIPISSKSTLLENAITALQQAKKAGVELHIIAESLSVKRDEQARREAAEHAAILQGFITGAIRDLERVRK